MVGKIIEQISTRTSLGKCTATIQDSVGFVVLESESLFSLVAETRTEFIGKNITQLAAKTVTR